MRRVLVMPDYDADPVWDAEAQTMEDLDALPVSDASRVALRAWARRWEAVAHRDLGQPGEPGAEEWEALEAEGRAAWLALREDLGQGWEAGWVSFRGEERYVQWSPEAPAEPFPPPPDAS